MVEELTNRQIAQRERRVREAAERSQPAMPPVEPERVIAQVEAVAQEQGQATPPPLESTERADDAQAIATPLVSESMPGEAPSGLSAEDTPQGPTDDDSSAHLLMSYEEREIQRLTQEIKELTQRARPASPAGTPATTQAPAPPPDPADPLGIRLVGYAVGSRPAPEGTWGPVAGVQAFRTQVLGGVRDAVHNTFQALDSFAEWANTNLVDLGTAGTGVKMFEDLPEIEAPDSIPGGLVHGVSQFVTGFIPFMKGIKAAQMGTKAGATSGFIQSELAAGSAASLVFDPMEENLSNLIEEVPALSNPITQFLSKQEDDSESMGRIKDALEGLGLGALFEGVYRGVRAIKQARYEKGWVPTPEGEMEINPFRDLGDPGGPNIVNTSEADVARTFSTGEQQELDRIISQRVSPLEAYSDADGSLLREFIQSQAVPEDTVLYRGGEVKPGQKTISASSDLKVAQDFASIGSESVNSISIIRIPKGSPALDVNQYFTDAKARGVASPELLGKMDGQKEFVLPVGDKWELRLVKERAPTPDANGRMLPTKEYELVPVKKADDVSESLVRQWINGEVPTSSLPFKINWAGISDEASVTKLLDDVSQLFTGKIDEGRRGKITDEQLRKMADDLNMTPQDLLARQSGQAFNAERVLASRMVLEASANQLVDMGTRFKNSLDEREMYQLMRMMNLHVGLQSQFQGAASEAGRALRAYQLPTGSPEKQIRDIQEQLMAGGGPC